MKKILWLLAAAWALPATAAFKCVDENGRTHIGDTPPPGCASVMMYELNKLNQVVREIPPSLTPEQLKQKQVDDAKKREAAKAAAEQKRKDMTLLQTFSSEKEFDVVRDRNIDPLKSRINAAHERIKAVDKREKEVGEEMEFYKAGKSGKSKEAKAKEPPRMLVEEQERLKKERENLHRSIAGYEKEIEDTRAKFEVDKKRWVALKSQEGKAPDKAVPTSAPAEPKAAPKK